MSMTPQADAMTAVFAHVRKSLVGKPMALEVLETYEEDSRYGRMNVTRLQGFLQGLSAGGALLYEDYCEVDAILINAFDL
jgi:hypothetical protein